VIYTRLFSSAGSVFLDFEHNAAFYDNVATRYDAHMCQKPTDVLARRAFVDFVTLHIAARSTLLDFGCRTGLDALEYVRRGFRVQAYDNSPGMIAELKKSCSADIASGNISTSSVSYPQFRSRFPFEQLPQAVVSDFAVLNMIGDVQTLFDFFARHLAPPGWMILSILNPHHWTKLRTSHWWSIAFRNSGREAPINLTEPYLSYMHFVPAIVLAAPQFRLVGRANAGAFVRYDSIPADIRQRRWWQDPAAKAGRFRRFVWHTPAHRMLGDFMFLVLRRDR
jgi:SAM-dependent methyltransferase